MRLTSQKSTFLSMVIKILFGYIITILGGSFFVSSMFRLVNFKEGKFSGIKYARMLIGFFERFIILTLVLLNQCIFCNSLWRDNEVFAETLILQKKPETKQKVKVIRFVSIIFA